MKNWPLFWQLWVWFVGMVAGVALIILLMTPLTLTNFFDGEITEQLVTAQQQFMARLNNMDAGNPVPNDPVLQGNLRAVRHLIYSTDGQLMFQMFGGRNRDFGGRGNDDGLQTPPNRQNRMDFGRRGNADIEALIIDQVKHVHPNDAVKIVNLQGQQDLTVTALLPVKINDVNYVLVSMIAGTYRDQLVNTLYRQLLTIIAVALVVSWVPAFLLARFLSRPLVQIQQQVQRIAKHEWHEQLVTDRKDEIGMLSNAVEEMRVDLINSAKDQQTLLQHLSHEMKTPVMVIRSYIQSIKDGIFPKGDLALTLETMDAQTVRLQKRIEDLIFFTKLKHWSEQPLKLQPVEFDRLIDDTLDNYRHHRPEVEWETDLEPVAVIGDAGRWQIAVENLFENQLRYAKKRIFVQLSRLTGEQVPEQSGTMVVLVIENDGDPMPEALLGERFEPFQKGVGGQHGLGLAIAQRIFDLHGAKLTVENIQDGVRFKIEWPQSEEILSMGAEQGGEPLDEA